MRFPVLVLTVLLAAATAVGAQTTPAGATPPATPAATVNAARLDAYLLRWEQEMRKVQTLAAALARVDKDKSFGSTTKYNGVAQYMKSGTGPTTMNLALLEMKQEGKTDLAEKFVCTGTYLYQFLPAQKEIRAYEMPKPKPGQVAEDSFLGFLFGMKADEAKRRYTLSLAKEDTWYIYVDIVPRTAADRADFARARLVLNKDSYLPRQLWFEHANGNEIIWDIPRLQSGVALDRRAFDTPKVPQGWKFQAVNRATGGSGTDAAPSADARPRVIRSNPER